ncbi:hypothetical protein TNCV_2545421 [Trichonephila clavipes]|nr:hypothetical protein TNCV_2545421 [Trichonephila clavipes]
MKFRPWDVDFGKRVYLTLQNTSPQLRSACVGQLGRKSSLLGPVVERFYSCLLWLVDEELIAYRSVATAVSANDTGPLSFRGRNMCNHSPTNRVPIHKKGP